MFIKNIGTIGDMSIMPAIGGIILLNGVKTGSVISSNSLNGWLYQFIFGNQDNKILRIRINCNKFKISMRPFNNTTCKILLLKAIR
jgi:hypothetical protein